MTQKVCKLRFSATKNRCTIFTVGMAVLLFGCIKKVEQGFSPGDDSLAQKVFEGALVDSGLKWTKDSEGYYLVPDATTDELKKISNRAHEMASGSLSVTIKSNCELELIEENLTDRSATYIVDERRQPPELRVLASDLTPAALAELQADAVFKCSFPLK